MHNSSTYTMNSFHDWIAPQFVSHQGRSMKCQILLLVSLGTLLLQGKCMGHGERMLIDEYKEAIQNYMMTGQDKGWMQCDIISDGKSFEPGRQIHEANPYISMDMARIKRFNMKEQRYIASVTLASSHCLLAIYNIESKASLSSILDFGIAAFKYVRLALVLKLNSGLTLDTISNVTNLPFLVAAESKDGNREFLCPVVGEKEPRSELDMCDPSYVSPMNKTLRVGMWGSYPNVINTELHQGIDFSLLTMLAKKLKFTPKIIAPPSYIESVTMVCLHISA